MTCKIRNAKNEYVIGWYYTGYPFSGYNFQFGSKENALNIKKAKAEDMIQRDNICFSNTVLYDKEQLTLSLE